MNEAARAPAGHDSAVSHKAMIAMALIIMVAVVGGLGALLVFSL